MKLANNNYGNNDPRWYQIVFVWMIILPVFLIAIVPDGAWHPFIVAVFILMAISGVLLVWYVPTTKRKKNKTKES